jgi:hypothetical protein
LIWGPEAEGTRFDRRDFSNLSVEGVHEYRRSIRRHQDDLAGLHTSSVRNFGTLVQIAKGLRGASAAIPYGP